MCIRDSQNGQGLTDYTGMAVNEYGWWYFKDGQLDFSYTGMACNEYGWWYFNNGQLNLTFNGLAAVSYTHLIVKMYINQKIR